MAGRSSANRKYSILRTLLVGMFLGVSVTRTILSIARSEKDLKRSNNLYDLAANNLPTVRGDLKKPLAALSANTIHSEEGSGQEPTRRIVAESDNPISKTVLGQDLLETKAADENGKVLQAKGTASAINIASNKVVQTNVKLVKSDNENKALPSKPTTLPFTKTENNTTTGDGINVQANTGGKTISTKQTGSGSKVMEKGSIEHHAMIETVKIINTTARTGITEADDHGPLTGNSNQSESVAIPENGKGKDTTEIQAPFTVSNQTKPIQTGGENLSLIDNAKEGIVAIASNTSQHNVLTQKSNPKKAATISINGKNKKDAQAHSTVLNPAKSSITVGENMSLVNNDALMKLAAASKISKTKKIVEFEHQDGVVIVTKIHGTHQLNLLTQSLCLLHYAYNSRLKYDIVVFSTTAVNETDLVDIRQMVAPANFSLVVDNDGLHNEINKLSPIRRKKFLRRCNVTSPEQLNWWSKCYEDAVGMGRIAYNWQAEFRSWHIWKQKALAPYRYMLWLDSDSFCSKVWDRDPVAIAMQNQLVIFFGNFPMGRGQGVDLQRRIHRSFNQTLCKVKLKDGHLHSVVGRICKEASVADIHGFFHITDLDFYRSDPVTYWAKTLIGDCYLCRRFDDQVAVTVPAAMLAPERAWDMYAHNITLGVGHNSKMDGKRKAPFGGFIRHWTKTAETEFPEAWGRCNIVAAVR